MFPYQIVREKRFVKYYLHCKAQFFHFEKLHIVLFIESYVCLQLSAIIQLVSPSSWNVS